MTVEPSLDISPVSQPEIRSCYAHLQSPSKGYCFQCNRPVCETCAFTIPMGWMCPDCMTSGASPQERRSNLGYAVGSLLLAVLGIALLVAAMASSFLFTPEEAETFAKVVGILALGSVLGGITLGLIGREHAKRTGSPLALIGVIANGALLAVYGVLTIVGLSS
ncbi:MAG: B-box zinc finger protein [Deltaproteobacteria bacterium]|nr:B-box zinc finger protein [Deltaproteobacteria bacterium]